MDENKFENCESSDSSDAEEEDLLEKRADELEKLISANNFLYDAHLELVEIYRKLTDLASLRAAYERFREVFPLTPTIWLSWIKDEITVANTEKEKQKILQLFQHAVKDYLSVKLWLEYAQFSIGVCEITETRKILENGLQAVGLHVHSGSLLWDTFREVELAHLSLIDTKSEAYVGQINRIFELFRRQLSVPLMNMENTYEEYQLFKNDLKNKNIDGIEDKSYEVEFSYKQALKSLETYKPFEEQLLSYVTDKLSIYKSYAKIVNDPSLKICLYERAVADFALNPELWLEYCYFVLNLNVGLEISERALRNCPWDEELWIVRLRTQEFHGEPPNLIMQSFEKAIEAISPNCGLELWLSYLEYSNRNLEDLEKLLKLFSQAETVLSDFDPTCKLRRFEARVLARKNRMEAARKVWGEIFKKTGRNQVNFWLEFAGLEKQFGDSKNLRLLYQKALNSCKDWQENISEEWLMFEREIGSLPDVLKCLEAVAKVKKPVCETNLKSDKMKRVREDDQTNSSSKRLKKTAKKPETELQLDQKPSNVNNTVDPEKSVFVSNLPYSCTEEDLKETFPNSTQIIKPPSKKFKPCCYAYVTFSTPEEAATALARDREPFKGRPIFISECKPEKSQRSKFKYSLESEKNKLFVRGLPFVTNQEAVTNIFKPYGAINVRLVTKKNGQSKGCAYVDFADAETAEEAIKHTNGLKVGEHTITVAVSAPPPKQENKDEFVRPKEPPIRNSRSKLSVGLIPRGVQLKQLAKTEASANDSSKTEVSANDSSKTSKSNEDFRKMLLNK